MRDIMELCAQFQSSVSAEANHLIRDGVRRRNALEERAAELKRRRDVELSNVDEWAELQRAMLSNLFEGLLDAVRDDDEANERSLARLLDDAEKFSKPHAVTEPITNTVASVDLVEESKGDPIA